MDGSLREKETFLPGATKRSTVSVRLSEVGVPGVQMCIEVDESDRAVNAVDCAEERERECVVSSQRQHTAMATAT